MSAWAKPRTIAIVAALALIAASAFLAQSQIPLPSPETEVAWMCPMHPDYTISDQTPGERKCPKCGMALVRSNPYDVRDYDLELTTEPKLVRAGQKMKLRFQIKHPTTGGAVQKFETVHEKQYHLFLISQDMEFFQHVHPELQADGSWTIEATIPKPGYYKVLSDFLPSGGTSQFIARPLVTAGFVGDLASGSAHLVPDTKLTKSDGDLSATISYDPAVCQVGLYCHLNYVLSDTKSGRPVNDLQTYLGAFGHTLIMSEDMVDYVHSHPLDLLARQPEDGGPPQFTIEPGADLEALRGGPNVTFEGLMPKPGRYRAWTQFRRNNQIHTFAFTFEAVPQ